MNGQMNGGDKMLRGRSHIAWSHARCCWRREIATMCVRELKRASERKASVRVAGSGIN